MSELLKILFIYALPLYALIGIALARKERRTARQAAAGRSTPQSQYNDARYRNIAASLALEPCSFCQKPRGSGDRCTTCGAPL